MGETLGGLGDDVPADVDGVLVIFRESVGVEAADTEDMDEYLRF